MTTVGKAITPPDLAARWGTTTGTLAQWRSKGRGPRSLRLGTSVRYRLNDIEEYERLAVVDTLEQRAGVPA